jgi:glycine dehydrogenase subunit 2
VMMADDGSFYLDRDREKTIGKVRSFIGQFGVLVRCWAYISACGPIGLRNVSETAVLNANYIAAKLCGRYSMPFFDPENGKFCAHEFVTVPQELLDKGVTLIDIAKRMIDYGVHPPTMHWPVHNCFMVEPTETESKQALDSFIDVMLQIAEEISSDIELVQQSPQESDITRADEVGAARKPVITYK